MSAAVSFVWRSSTFALVSTPKTSLVFLPLSAFQLLSHQLPRH